MDTSTVTPTTTAAAAEETVSAAKRLKSTHTKLNQAMPIVTSLLSIMGVVISLMGEDVETKSAKKAKRAKEAKDSDGADDANKVYLERHTHGYSFFSHLFTLLHHLVSALALIVAVGFLVVLAFIAQPISTTLALTALVMLALWLSEVSSRRG